MPKGVVEPAEVRFWRFVQKTDGCWLWTGQLNAKGYGLIEVGGKPTKAHRVAYRLAFGPVPHGMLVCHHCDNPPCVRPDHLYAGSAKDNARDAMERGRWTPGAGPPRKLTDKQVVSARAAVRLGLGLRQTARRLGVSHSTLLRNLKTRA